VLIPEPFPFLISAQLGVMWFKVEIFGKPVHVLQAGSGINAIDAAFKLYDGLRQLEVDYNSAEKRHSHYAAVQHPINFNFGVIRGGDWASSVPSSCEFEVRVGFFPGVAVRDVQVDIERTLESTAAKFSSPVSYKVRYRGFQADGCVLDLENEPIRTLRNCHSIVTQKPLPTAPVTCTTDARHFVLLQGTPVACYGPEASSIHGIDESVSLQSVQDVAAVYALFLKNWCGLEKL